MNTHIRSLITVGLVLLSGCGGGGGTIEPIEPWSYIGSWSGSFRVSSQTADPGQTEFVITENPQWGGGNISGAFEIMRDGVAHPATVVSGWIGVSADGTRNSVTLVYTMDEENDPNAQYMLRSGSWSHVSDGSLAINGFIPNEHNAALLVVYITLYRAGE